MVDVIIKEIKKIRKVRIDKRDYICNLCNKNFKDNYALNRHLKSKLHLKKFGLNNKLGKVDKFGLIDFN